MSLVEIQYRQCTAKDAPVLALLGAATFLEAYAGWIPGDAILGHCFRNHTEAAYVGYLAQPGSCAWLAEVAPGAAPVGYALLTAPDFAPELIRPGDAELKRIYAFSRFQRGRDGSGPGVGQGLMDLAMTHARTQGKSRLLLGLHQDNERALRFYKKNGFERIGARRFQVGAMVFDDLVMARALQ